MTLALSPLGGIRITVGAEDRSSQPFALTSSVPFIISNTVRRALSTPDILEEIIEQLPNSGRLHQHSCVSRTPKDVNWDRFNSYAERVRSIAWNDEKGTLSQQIFAQIFVHRPHTHPLLPNLKTIEWTASSEDTAMKMLPLASKSLKLRIKHACPAESLATGLKGLDDRRVRFESLDIEAWFGAGEIKRTLASYLRDQWELKVVGLPQYYGTRDIVTALGSLPKLEVLRTTNRLPEQKNGMEWKLLQGAVTNWLPALSTEHLTPLFQIGTPEVLEIDNRKPIIGINSVFVAFMANHWPALRRFRLASEPCDEAAPRVGNSLEILRHFAASFGNSKHRLESIGLYFHVNLKELLHTRGTQTLPPTLRELDVGTSRIEGDEIFPVANFLGGLFKPGLAIQAGRRYTESGHHDKQAVALWEKLRSA
ncbi:hypothetical protein FRB97_008972 [Tulasnella sp. 331]|nr:hypothetical protein FRB97_008972 [Tulasnella sp. 331]